MLFKSLAPSKINNTEYFKIPPQCFRNALGAFRTRLKCYSYPGGVKYRKRDDTRTRGQGEITVTCEGGQ